MAVRCDYLVKGAGAMAMSFLDVMVRETDATFAVVDKRPAPGGHWNDAYPFVRLHQPSAYYGVASRELGRGRKDVSGTNAGLYELATGVSVADYFHEVMRETLLPTGRVQYFPMSEITDDGQILGLLSGARQTVEVARRRVDGTLINTSIPLAHTRKFEVAEGVICVPPNDLGRLAPNHKAFVILGAGKTALDSVSWLLSNGAAPDSIQWVLPRDPWLINRRMMQPGVEFFDDSVGVFAQQYEIFATAASLDEIGERMAELGSWLRLDETIKPSMFHGGTITPVELEHVRQVKGLIRMGRVKRVEAGRLILDGGEVEVPRGALFIDCTASALGHNVRLRKPVFTPGQINLQMIRQYSPCFSAALIGHLEATVEDDDAKNAIARATPMTDTLEDWLVMVIDSLRNQFAWSADRQLAGWIAGSRLDQLGLTFKQVDPADEGKKAVRNRLRATAGPALENLTRLAARLRPN